MIEGISIIVGLTLFTLFVASLVIRSGIAHAGEVMACRIQTGLNGIAEQVQKKIFTVTLETGMDLTKPITIISRPGSPFIEPTPQVNMVSNVVIPPPPPTPIKTSSSNKKTVKSH